MRTREPRLSSAPGCGLCATTMPAGSAEGTSNTRATKPALRTLRAGLLGSGPEQARHGDAAGPGRDADGHRRTGGDGLAGLRLGCDDDARRHGPRRRRGSAASGRSSRSRFSATGRGSPIRRGTTDGPAETISNTSRAASSRLPPPGSCLSTRPRGRALGTAGDDRAQARRRDPPARLGLAELDDGRNAHLLRGGIRPRAGDLDCAGEENEQQQDPGRSGTEEAHRADDRVAARCEG